MSSRFAGPRHRYLWLVLAIVTVYVVVSYLIMPATSSESSMSRDCQNEQW